MPLTLFGLDSKGSEQPLKVFKQWLTLTHWLLSHVDLILAHILCITHKDCIIQIFPHLLHQAGGISVTLLDVLGFTHFFILPCTLFCVPV